MESTNNSKCLRLFFKIGFSQITMILGYFLIKYTVKYFFGPRT